MTQSLLGRRILVTRPAAQAAMLAAMASTEMKPVIDSAFTFDDYPKAYDRLQSGNVTGKVVIEL